MKKKNKVIILSSVLATGAIAATAAVVPSVLKNKGSKVNNTIINTIETKDIKNPIITNEQEEKLPPVVSNKPTEESFRKFELSFEKLNEESKGKAGFYFENTNGELYNKVLASFDDKVYFKVQMNDKSNLTLTDLRVYVNNNEA